MEEKKSGHNGLVIIILILVILGMGSILLVESLYILVKDSPGLPFDKLNPNVGNKIAVIYVEGEMVTDNVPAGFGYASSTSIVKSLREAQEDSSVKAIVLRINSPGGTPVAAQEIYSQIQKTREVKPVVASMGDMATSAAYYISAPCSRIVANPDSFTGSIGVIWVFENKSEQYSKEGVQYYVAKTGSYKDLGADWRGLDENEKAYVNSIINESYSRFVASVSDSRHIPYNDVEKLADGRIYTGQQAKELGLVDDIGNLYDAIDIAAKLANISNTPEITYLNEPSLYDILFGSQNSEIVQQQAYSGYAYNAMPRVVNGVIGLYPAPYGRLYMI